MMARSSKRLEPAPVRTAHDQPYWEATARGALAYKRCDACGQAHWYPRKYCPFCGSADTRWQDSSGHGTIYSFSIVAGSRRPTAPAQVVLDEGLLISTRIADADVHGMRIGDKVRVGFDEAEDGSAIPYFTTLAADAARAYSAASLAASQDLALGSPAPVGVVGVVGAGTMGTGIAKALVKGGVRVLLVDPDQAARDRAAADVAAYVERLTGEGREPGAIELLASIDGLADADLVIEAVWEQQSLKQQVLADLDRIVKPAGVLASNTSTLDLDALASATSRPERVLGLHFFSPAHVMRLVEVVRGARTSPEALATATALGRAIGKTPVVVGVCPGFVGNRMMIARNQQSGALLLEGALPEQVDRVMREVGLPMGPYEMLDLGNAIELSYRRRQETGEESWLVDQLYLKGRVGQRTKAGYYRYVEDKPGRPLRAQPDPEVAALVREASAREGIQRRRIGDEEIRDRLVLPMINEGAKLVDEGIVARASDIDVVWRDGFGWPDWKGGPMHYADRIGLQHIVDRLTELAERHGAELAPAPLLVRMAAAGATFTGGEPQGGTP